MHKTCLERSCSKYLLVWIFSFAILVVKLIVPQKYHYGKNPSNNRTASVHSSFRGLLFGVHDISSVPVIYERLLKNNTVSAYPAFRHSLEDELQCFKNYLSSPQFINKKEKTMDTQSFLPQYKYLKVTEYDRGHGLNNIRTMYTLALMYGRATQRIVVLPDVIMAFSHWLPALDRATQPIDSAFIKITELFDVDAMNAVDPSHYRVELQSWLPESMKNEFFGLHAWDSANIYGSSFRPWKTWNDMRTINFITNYPGVLLTTPYFFCDAYDSHSESYRLQANNIFRWSPWLNRTINNIYNSTRQTYPNQKIIAIHLRIEPIYSVTAQGRIERLTAIADYLRAQGYSRRNSVLFLAGGNIDEQMISTLRLHYRYDIVRKEQFLPKDWEPPLWSKYLSMKASAIDFELCVLSDLFLGNSESSFTMLVAAQRKMSRRVHIGYDYAKRTELCSENKPCFYYC